jgi:hypothetical protein
MDPDYSPWGLDDVFKFFLDLNSFLLDPPLDKNPLKKDFFEIPLRVPLDAAYDLFSFILPVDAFPLDLRLVAGRNLEDWGIPLV